MENNIKDIESKKETFLKKIQKTEVRRGREISNLDFLLGIKNELEKAYKNKLSFKQISNLIKEVFQVDVSPNSIRTFATNYFGHKPKKAIKNNVSKNNDTTQTPKKTTDDNIRIKAKKFGEI